MPGHGRRRGASTPQPMDSTLPQEERVHSPADAELPYISVEPPRNEEAKACREESPTQLSSQTMEE